MAPKKKVESDDIKTSRGSYEHYIKSVPVLENFEEIYKLKYHLVKSYDELIDFYNNVFVPNGIIAFDTETTSLNPEQGTKTGDLVEGKIVGYSFTQNGSDGYYVPLCHPDYHLGYKALKVLYAMLCKSSLVLMYNARFDMRFFEFMTPEKYDYTPEPNEKIYPFDLSRIKYFDVQCSVWLSDTNIPMPSLKKSEKHFLGWNPPTFADTVGDESNFGYLPAEQGYRYACIDALGTYHLYNKTKIFYAESGAAGKLDNESLFPIMRLENSPIYVDHDYLESMRGDVHKHLNDLKNYLYTEVGMEYNISSNRELVGVFQQLGIDTGKRTSSGQMSTDIKTIENYLVSHGDNEYLKKLIEYKKLLKFDNSYLEKLIEISSKDAVAKHPIRFNYFTCRVPTGRLACGTDGKNTFFSPVNFQCLKHDTRVLTKDGRKQIKDIVTGDLVWDGEKYMPCVQLGSKTKELIKVSCGNGHFLEASKEHQVYAIKNNKPGWYRLGELTTDDYLAVNRKFEDSKDVSTLIDKGNTYNPLGGIKRREIHIDKPLYDFWFLCGYLVGDGCFFKYKDHCAGFGLCVPKLKETAMNRLYSGFREVGIEPFEKVSRKEGYEPGKSLNTKSANLAEALIDMGFKHLAKNKCIPEIVFSLSPRQKFAFIDGMISTDGTVGESIGYKTTSKQLAYDLRDLLETVGYYSTVTDQGNSVFNVIIHDKARFRSEIGLTVSYKNETLYKSLKPKGNGLPCDYYKKIKRKDNSITCNSLNEIEDLGYKEASFGWKKISKIESVGEDIVYDLYVDESHRFTANGFIVHNSLPKPHSHNYHVHKATPEQIANGEDLCGYIFDDNPENSLGLTEGQDPHLNVRKAFRAAHSDEDSVVISVDMKAEELRLVANVYQEPTWINAFNTGQDVHKATAIKIFGEENYCKEARKKAKAASFGILYGSSAYGFHNQFPDMSLEECEDFINTFKATLPSIEKGQKESVRYAKKNGYVKTYFGRPRRVKYYLTHPDRSKRSFGERTCKNTQIQGCAGDILKLMLVRMWKDLFIPYRDKGVRWLGTIHDEINVICPKSILPEVAGIIMRCQTVKLPDWPVTIEPDFSCGKSFGELIPFNLTYNEDGSVKEFVPQMEEIKHETESAHEQSVESYVPEVEDDYDYMQ